MKPPVLPAGHRAARWRPALGACIAVLVAGLASAASAQPAAADLRGFLLEGFGASPWLFRQCVGKTLARPLLQVVDPSPGRNVQGGVEEIRKMMLDRERPIYVEFRGQISGQVVTVRQFQRTIGHVEECAEAPRDIAPATRLQAQGDEPRWQFVATAAGARFEAEGSAPVRFPAAAFAAPTVRDGTRRIYDAWSPQDGGSIRIEITEEVCNDGHSETAFGARVTARLGSRTFEGCAARF
jgi:uncharacterized membrane protein